MSSLATQLTAEYGRGFDRTNLSRMVKVAEYFPDEEIVATLSQQLSWSHFRELLPLDDPLKRDFYAEMCRLERWSVRTLQKKIGGMLFERTALSKKPDQLIRQELDALRKEDHLTPDLVFREKSRPVGRNLSNRTGIIESTQTRRAVTVPRGLPPSHTAEKTACATSP